MEIKKFFAKKVYKILCDHKIRVPFSTVWENTFKLANGKYTVRISLENKSIRENKNFFYNFFNARVNYDTNTVSFVYDENDYYETEKTDDEKLNSIMEKINKLLNVTEERGASEGEAIACSLRAQALMKKYNIDISNIRKNENEEILNLEADTPTGNKWKYSFAYSVAQSYRCNVYRKGNTIIFRGYKSDILIARRVFMYLLDTCIRLGKKEQRTGEDYTSFCLGFCDGVSERLSENCKALSLITPREVEEEWEEYHKNFKNPTHFSFKEVDKNTYRKGNVEGKKAVDGQYIDTRADNSAQEELKQIGMEQ